jgi:hypothetical protein
MADNSPPHHMSEKIDKSLEEERGPKHAKTDAKSKTEILPPGTLAESLRRVRSRLPWSRAGGPGAAPVAPIHRDVGSAAVTAGVSLTISVDVVEARSKCGAQRGEVVLALSSRAREPGAAEYAGCEAPFSGRVWAVRAHRSPLEGVFASLPDSTDRALA